MKFYEIITVEDPWLDCQQESRCIYAMIRKSASEQIAAIFNFGNQKQHYTVSISDAEKLHLLVNTEWACYGGNCQENEGIFSLEHGELSCDLMPYSGMMFSIE